MVSFRQCVRKSHLSSIATGLAFLSLAAVQPAGATPTSVSYPSSDPSAKLFAEKVTISAQLWKPDGQGPFPSIIAVHGCNGPKQFEELWIDKFVSWGYLVIRPNSLKARGLATACTSRTQRHKKFPTVGEKRLTPQQRVFDVADTLRYLQSLPFVDKARVAVVGWSQGGDTAFLAAEDSSSRGAFAGIEQPLKGAVSFYPRCYFLGAPKFNAPLLVLVGDVDEWADALSCRQHVQQRQSVDIPAEVVVYSNAYHAFDSPSANASVHGYRVLYNEKAHRDSIERVRRFLMLAFAN